MAADNSSALADSLRKCSVLLIRCNLGRRLGGDSERGLSGQVRACFDGLLTPPLARRAATCEGSAAAHVRECSVRLTRWEGQQQLEGLHPPAIKTEHGADITAVSHGLFLEHTWLRQNLDCDRPPHAEVNVLVIKTENEKDGVIVKQELDIGPTVLQVPAQCLEVTSELAASYETSSAEDVDASSTTSTENMYINGDENNLNVKVLPMGEETCAYEDSIASLSGAQQPRLNEKGHRNFVCDQCGYLTRRKSNLIKHIHKHANQETRKRKRRGNIKTKKRTSKKFMGGEKQQVFEKCEYSTNQNSDMKNHMYKHRDEEQYEDNQYESNSNQSAQLKFNMAKSTGDDTMHCDHCEYKTFSKYSLMSHMYSHREKPFKCDQCKFSTNIKCNLHRHKFIHTDKKPYKCAQCDYRTASKTNLKNHLYTHSDGEPYEDNQYESNSNQSAQLKFNMAKSTGDDTMHCDHCEYKTFSKYSLMSHMYSHREKPFKCDQCKFSTNIKCNLHRHKFIHIHKKPYKCAQCDYRTASKTNLKNHMYTHSDGEPYEDNQYESNSNQSDQLKFNMTKYTGDDSMHCDHCEYKTFSKYSLMSHMYSHREKPFKCDQCKFSTNIKCNLHRHKFIHIHKKPYKCAQCDYRTASKTNLKNHMYTHSDGEPYEDNQYESNSNQSDQLKFNMTKYTGDDSMHCDHSSPMDVVDYKCENNAEDIDASSTTFTENTNINGDHNNLSVKVLPVREETFAYQDSIASLSGAQDPVLNEKIHRHYVHDQCGYITRRKSNLTKHKHTNKEYHKRKQCGNSKTKKRTSKKFMGGEKQQVFEKCEYSTNQNSDMKNHMYKHRDEEQYEDNQYESNSNQSAQLKFNMAKYTGDDTMHCDHCEYKTFSKYSLMSHMYSHREKPFKCDQCKFSTNIKCNLHRHKFIHIDKKPYKCAQCDYRTASKTNLKNHLYTHSDGEPYEGNQYESNSNQSAQLKFNMAKYTGDDSMHCDHCEYKTFSKYSLMSHMYSHREKPFQCDQCKFSTNIKCNLKRHKFIHTDKKPYKCAQCEYKTASKTNLKNHMYTHSDGEPYEDNQYESNSNQSAQLKFNMAKSTGDDSMHCDHSSPMDVVNYKCEDNAEDIDASSTTFTENTNINGDHNNLSVKVLPVREETFAYQDSIASLSGAQDPVLNEKIHRHYVHDQCGYITRRKSNLTKHKHTNKESHKRKQCGNSKTKKRTSKKFIGGEKQQVFEKCEYSTNRNSDIKNHMYKHRDEEPYEDNQYESNSNQSAQLKFNMAKSTGDDTMHCDHCEYKTFSKYSLMSHMYSHREKPFKCDQCKFSTNIKCNLKRHKFIHTDKKPYKCAQCEYKTASKTNLKNHMYTHSDGEPYEDNQYESNSNQSAQLKFNMAKSTGDDTMHCDHCEYKTFSKYSLMSHMYSHREKPFKCDQCKFSTNIKCNLKRHKFIHTDKKPYKCAQCEYKTASKTNLKNHMYTHTDENPFKCELCEYSAKEKRNLKRHMGLKHTGDKPYRCELCSYKTCEKGMLNRHLNRHLNIHKGLKSYKCEHCEYSTHEKSGLKRHLYTHTGYKPISCEQCGYRTFQNSKLKRHMTIHAVKTKK